MVNFNDLSFFKVPEGVQLFPGGGGGGGGGVVVQLFPGGGVQLLNPYNLRFSRGGVRTPYPPSGSALVSPQWDQLLAMLGLLYVDK